MSELNDRNHSRRLGRELAMEFFFRCDVSGEVPAIESYERIYEEISVPERGLKDNRFARKGNEYAEKLIEQITVEREKIDRRIIDQAKNWSFERLDPVDRNIMRIAVCEMLFIDEVPLVVSIDEAVGIAVDYSGEQSANFINGVLNGIKNELLKQPGFHKQ